MKSYAFCFMMGREASLNSLWLSEPEWHNCTYSLLWKSVISDHCGSDCATKLQSCWSGISLPLFPCQTFGWMTKKGRLRQNDCLLSSYHILENTHLAVKYRWGTFFPSLLISNINLNRRFSFINQIPSKGSHHNHFYGSPFLTSKHWIVISLKQQG